MYLIIEVKASRLHSVFDLLYKQYTKERLTYESSHETVSDFLSENLIYDTLVQAINQPGLTNRGDNTLTKQPLQTFQRQTPSM